MRELTNPADLAAVQAALAQGSGLAASTAAPGSALAGMVDQARSPFPNPFDAIKYLLAQGQSATLQFCTDSTGVSGSPDNVFGTQDRRYIGQWLDQLISTGMLDMVAPPGCGVRVYRFLNGFYNATYTETLRGSTSGQWLNVYQASVSGASPHYFMGGFFFNSLLGVAPDAMIVAHGINISTWDDASFFGVMMAFAEQYRHAHPETPIGFVTQHPNRDATTYDSISRILRARANLLRAQVNDDAFAEFIAAGKPASYYNSDGIHESPGPGCAPYVRALNRWWNDARPVPAPFTLSRFAMPAGRNQLIKNGDFRTWTNTAAAPDGWNTIGTPVFAKDTAIYADEKKSFSVRMTSTGSTATRLTQPVPLTSDKTYTLAARMRRDTAGSGNLGRLSFSANTPGGNVQVTQPGFVIQQNGFAWWVLPVTLPSDTTSATISVYADTTSPPDATYGIWLDQVSLVPGLCPMAFSV